MVKFNNPTFQPTQHIFSWLVLFIIASINFGCSSTSIFVKQAEQFSFATEIVQGCDFQHAVMRKPGKGNTLHVYIEGDGSPWIMERWIATDPTPVKMIMPTLMALDPAPALFLGRPCYFQTDDTQCNERWWTSARYGEKITESLNCALNGSMEQFESVWLIGHSGGGALAMLMAAQRDDVKKIITLAGNLDIEAWTKAHKYSPLSESHNPANLAALPSYIEQLHFIAAQDDRITANMIKVTIKKQPGSRLIVMDDLDHSCCWEQVWTDILKSINGAQPSITKPI